MRQVFSRTLDVLSSMRLACVLLALLGLLTWLGTLEQVEHGLFEVQRKYFESFFLVHHAGPVPIPLPGANLVLSLLFVNLLVGGLLRIRKGAATAGVLVAHVGIAVLLVSAFVKHRFSQEGHVTLFEGQRSNVFQSYLLWEIAIAEDLGPSEDLGVWQAREHLVPHAELERALDGQLVRFTSPSLPFALEIQRFARNSEPRSAGGAHGDRSFPALDGVSLAELPTSPEAERNIAGAAIAVVDDQGGMRRPALLWGAERKPFAVTAAGKRWSITLRRERYPMPFAVVLDKFTKEDHPGIEMPKAFSSDVTVVEGGSSRPVRIEMNAPLRSGGLVLYQASWGPAGARPGTPLFSTFAVVRNPADQLPLIGCIVIAIGLVWHFARKLVRYVRIQGAAS